MSKHPCMSSCPPATYQPSSKAIIDPTPFSSHKAVPGSIPTIDSALSVDDGMKC